MRNATDKNAVSATAPEPITNADSTFSRNCEDNVRAAPRIQKIIAVTSTTASTLKTPPRICCPRASSRLVENVRTAAKLAETASAVSAPTHTGRARRRA